MPGQAMRRSHQRGTRPQRTDPRPRVYIERSAEEQRALVDNIEYASWTVAVTHTVIVLSLRTPQIGIYPSDFQPLYVSICGDDDVTRTAGPIDYEHIVVTPSVITLTVRDEAVAVCHAPRLPRGVIELTIEHWVVRFYNHRRLAYGQSVP